jgi:hypothetical protein
VDITQANIEHAVLTQEHRWYQFYELEERYLAPFNQKFFVDHIGLNAKQVIKAEHKPS